MSIFRPRKSTRMWSSNGCALCIRPIILDHRIHMMITSSTTRDLPDLPHSFAPLLDRAYARPDFLKGLKTLMTAAQERIRNEHNAGARGRNVVRHLTALVDDVVRTVFQYVQAQQAAATEPCALVALGGYGRGELKPFSDTDILVLSQQTPSDPIVTTP